MRRDPGVADLVLGGSIDKVLDLLPERGMGKGGGGMVWVGAKEVVGVDDGSTVTVDEGMNGGGAQHVEKGSELGFVGGLEEAREEAAGAVG